MYADINAIYTAFPMFAHNNIIIMTEDYVRYMESAHVYSTSPPTKKAKIIKDCRTVCQIIHVAHDITRFKRINDVSKRMKPGPYATHYWSAGDPFIKGPRSLIPFVRWKPEFYTPMKVCLDNNILYVYLTPTGKWGAFSPLFKNSLEL